MARLKPEGLFDDPVFQRMKRNDHKPAAIFQSVDRVGDKSIQPFEFTVDRYAKRLESFCRRMNAPVTFRMNRSDHQIGKTSCCCDGRRVPLSDNAASYAPRGSLFTIFKDDIGQFALAEIIN